MKARKSDGFTLLEAVIAIAIFTIAFTQILALQGRSIQDAVQAKQFNTVAQLARNKMVETEVAVRGRAFGDVSKEESGVFKAPYQDYRWTVKIEELELPAISGASAEGAPQGQGQNEMAKQVTTAVTKYLSQSLRQVTVSIFWKRGNKEQVFTVSTYWVDMNREFTL